MKIGQFFVFAALLVFTTFFSCKKDESEEMIDVLTSKNWKFGLADLNVSTNPSGTNAYYAVLECEQDDVFTFRADGTMFRAYGSKKCNGSTDINKTVAYSFNKQTKELTIDGTKYTVLEENKSQFKYSITVSGTTGNSQLIYLLQ
ncbi:MAG: hypothetical protein EOO96_06590 [Pedobacter sp.]|nr:MAG: hypothetical protein EOO96_06590 [Pedobacter sp.]